MPKKRNAENRKLPQRWVFKHSSYFYVPKPEQRHQWDGRSWFPLGKLLPEAYQIWSVRIAAPETLTNIGDLLSRYAIEVIPNKAPKTQTNNRGYIAPLTEVFGKVALGDLEPQHIYQYIDKRRAKTAAKREIELLSHAFTKAVQWGLIKTHPFKGQIRIEGVDKPNNEKHLIEDWEVAEIMSLNPRRKKGSVRMIQAYITLKLLTGLRQRDLLLMTMSQIKEDGLHFTISKTKKTTGKSVIYDWSPKLREAVDSAIATRPALSSFLFCNRFGIGFVEPDGTAGNWNNMWQKFAARLRRETKITAKISDHAFRWKVGSEAENIERAQQLMGHADKRTTEKSYRLKPQRIQPTS